MKIEINVVKGVPHKPWSPARVMGAWAGVLFSLFFIFNIVLSIIYGVEYELDEWMTVVEALLTGGSFTALIAAGFFDIRSIRGRG